LNSSVIKIDRRIVQLKEAIPFQDARLPERHRQGQTEYELNQGWLRDPADDPNRLVDYRRETVSNPAALFSLAGFHCQSPR
jgi:hypothetical protein